MQSLEDQTVKTVNQHWRVWTRILKCFWLFPRSFFLIIRQPLVSRLPGFVSKQDFVQRLLSDRYCLSEFEAGRFKP